MIIFEDGDVVAVSFDSGGVWEVEVFGPFGALESEVVTDQMEVLPIPEAVFGAFGAVVEDGFQVMDSGWELVKEGSYSFFDCLALEQVDLVNGVFGNIELAGGVEF